MTVHLTSEKLGTCYIISINADTPLYEHSFLCVTVLIKCCHPWICEFIALELFGSYISDGFGGAN